MLRLDTDFALPFLEQPLEIFRDQVAAAHETLLNKSGAGNDFLGWRDMLLHPDDALLDDVAATAERIRHDADVLVCVGIGGSYLGAKAVIQALTPYFRPGAGVSAKDAGLTTPETTVGPLSGRQREVEIVFAGHHMSGAYLRELLAYLEGKSVYLNVISKSGTTLEPALAFRALRNWMNERYGASADRIIVTTDPTEGGLNQLQREMGYKKYVIPRDVGGRFSVLTPVGLLPIAVAGIDVRALFRGAVAGCERYAQPTGNPALDYAGLRYALLQQGYAVEAFATFEPRLSGIGEWWQQLYGESEGKEGTGLWPSRVSYSTDLHSVGQYVQQGQRILLETFLMAEDDGGSLTVPPSEQNLDGLEYLAGRTFTEVNRKAYEGTARAHKAGGVPNMTLWLDRIDEAALGEAIYFFEHAVSVSGYLLRINPFDQPGVEAYKKEMFSLLGKP